MEVAVSNDGRKESANREGVRKMSNVSKTQRLTSAYIDEIFRNLESGDGKGFFEHVADDVDWIVEGARFSLKINGRIEFDCRRPKLLLQ